MELQKKKIVRIDYEKCFHDGKCIPHCPVNAIQLKDGRVVVDEESCVGCGRCITACPMQAISFFEKETGLK